MFRKLKFSRLQTRQFVQAKPKENIIAISSWPKVKVAQAHFVLLAQLSNHPITGGINWRNDIDVLREITQCQKKSSA
jgi:hypothetical protein